MDIQELQNNPDLAGKIARIYRERIQQAADENKLADYSPYPKQREFHDAGRQHRERLMIAANQVGKSYCGAMKAAMHLTGIYPDWCGGDVVGIAL
jgi:hypothetical protein